MAVKNVSLTDFSSQQEDILRRKQLADLLQQKSMEPEPSPVARGPMGDVTTPLSWTQVLSKMLQGGMGGYQRAQLNQESKDLYSQQLNQYGAANDKLMASLSPQPAGPMQRPATNPTMEDLPKALMQYTNDIGQPQMGAQYAMRHAQQGMLARMLMGGQNGTQSGSGSSGQTGGTSQDSSMGMLPKDLETALLAVDPSGKMLVQERAKATMEGIKPVVNRGFGIGKMENGQYKPDPASLAQALEVKRGQENITQPYEPPITLKTSSGQEIQLSRVEWKKYQETGILPQRISGSPIQGTVPPQDMEAFNKVASADKMGIPMSAQGGLPQGLGQIGVSQSQEDQVKQAEQMATAAKFGGGLGETGTAIFTNGSKALDNLMALQQMEGMAATFTPGKLTPLAQGVAQWAIGIGIINEEEANAMFGNVGNMQGLTSASTKLAALTLRQSDGNPAVKQLELMLDAMPNKGQTPEGFAVTMKFMQAAEKMKIAKMQEAAQAFKSGLDIKGFEAEWSKKLPEMQEKIYGPLVQQSAKTDAVKLPPQAVSKLKENVSTTFGNGQVWTLQNGQPVRVK